MSFKTNIVQNARFASQPADCSVQREQLTKQQPPCPSKNLTNSMTISRVWGEYTLKYWARKNIHIHFKMKTCNTQSKRTKHTQKKILGIKNIHIHLT